MEVMVMKFVESRKSVLWVMIIVLTMGIVFGSSLAYGNEAPILFEVPAFKDWKLVPNSGEIKLDGNKVGIAGGPWKDGVGKIILPEPISFNSEEGITFEVEIHSQVKESPIVIDFVSSAWDNNAHYFSPFGVVSVFVRANEDEPRVFAVTKNPGNPNSISAGRGKYYNELQFPLKVRVWINATEYEVAVVGGEPSKGLNWDVDAPYRVEHGLDLAAWDGGVGYIAIVTLSAGEVVPNWISKVTVWKGRNID
jgi:hypothetical protein